MSALPSTPIEMRDCGREKVVTVSLNDDGYPRIEPETIRINRENDEIVVWRAEPGVNFTICFGDETPFESFHFHPCMSSSGKVRKGASGGEYKYCVEVSGKIIDPKVEVWPPH